MRSHALEDAVQPLCELRIRSVLTFISRTFVPLVDSWEDGIRFATMRHTRRLDDALLTTPRHSLRQPLRECVRNAARTLNRRCRYILEHSQPILDVGRLCSGDDLGFPACNGTARGLAGPGIQAQANPVICRQLQPKAP